MSSATRPKRAVSRTTRAKAPAEQLSVSIEDDPNHHLSGSFQPQTPLGASTPERTGSPVWRKGKPVGQKPISLWLRWVIEPSAALQLLVVPLILYVNWNLFASKLLPAGSSNPFGIFLLSGQVPTSRPDEPRYSKSLWDLSFIAYYVVFFSFVRQVITVKMGRPLAKYFGIKRESKVVRFGEQAYALVYFASFGAWGYRIMSQLPTFWYRTEHFWREYPHVQMTPELKRYYLMQYAYWFQQLLVMVLKLEKPRKDYTELVAHHLVTLWLVSWSYLLHLTYIGNAVYMSMDIPDAFFALAKLLNYIQWDRAKVVAFGVFVVVWSYFRHYLNIMMLWSVWSESHLAPESSKRWDYSTGAFLPTWIVHQTLLALGVLQLLNLLWYYLILRILVRTVITRDVDDDRSDHEGDDDDEDKED